MNETLNMNCFEWVNYFRLLFRPTQQQLNNKCLMFFATSLPTSHAPMPLTAVYPTLIGCCFSVPHNTKIRNRVCQ